MGCRGGLLLIGTAHDDRPDAGAQSGLGVTLGIGDVLIF
jgi:hypothetical protein